MLRGVALAAGLVVVGGSETSLAATATVDACTEDFYMQADYGAGFLTMRDDGSVWKSIAQYPSVRMLEVGTDNDRFADNSGQGVDYCVIKTDDSLWCWGQNADGVVGNGTQDPVLAPYQTLESVAEATVQRYWGCARKLDGTVWCWGNVLETQIIGDGTQGPSLVPKQVTLPGAATKIAVGFAHAFAILEDGRVFAWGFSGGFCVGLGDTEFYVTPTEVTTIGTDNKHITAGSFSSAVIKNDGRVFAWGFTTGDGTNQPVAAPREVTEVGANVQFLEARMHQLCAIREDGQLWCWGDENPEAQLGNASADIHEYVLVPEPFAGGFFTAGSPIRKVKMVKSQTCVLLEDRSLWCLGGGGFPDGHYVQGEPILAPTEQDWCNLCDIEECGQTCVAGQCVACTYDEQCLSDSRPFCDIESGECVTERVEPGSNAGASGCGGGARCTATPGRGPATFGAWLTLLGALGTIFAFRRLARR